MSLKCKGLERSQFLTFCHMSHFWGLERSQFQWKVLTHVAECLSCSSFSGTFNFVRCYRWCFLNKSCKSWCKLCVNVLGVRWWFDVWVQCGPLCWDSPVSLWMRRCAWVVMMMVNMWWEVLYMIRWMRCRCRFWCLFGFSYAYLNNGTTVVGSWNVTFFLGFGLGSWKESTLSLLLGFFFVALGGSWNDDPSWQSGFKWAQFLLYFFLFRPVML